jgi:hypothetical protein
MFTVSFADGIANLIAHAGQALELSEVGVK